MKWIFTVLTLLISGILTAQPKRICVMGSSSAYGYFPNTSIPRDSSWAFKISAHYKALNVIDTLYNIGTPGIDCYIGMPTGYSPPPGRNTPNPQFNITRAVNFNPPPDVIIINFPSNNYTVLSEAEIIFCLQTMKDYANAHNIRCYITTTQPRDDFVQPSERQKLKDLKALIEATFGVFAIDFWTDIVLDPPIVIRPEYALGDGVHLNPAGHTVLVNKVLEKDIFFGPVALQDLRLYATHRGNHVLLRWDSDELSGEGQWQLQRRIEGEEYQTLFEADAQTGNTIFFADENPVIGTNFYRLKYIPAEGSTIISPVVAVAFTGEQNSKPYLFPNPANGNAYLQFPPSAKNIRWQLVDVGGMVLQQGIISRADHWQTVPIPLAEKLSGTYFIRFPGSDQPALKLIRQ